jgi:hypothetical protein
MRQGVVIALVMVALTAVSADAASIDRWSASAEQPIGPTASRASSDGYNQWQELAALDAPLAHHMVAGVTAEGHPRLLVFGGKTSPNQPMRTTTLEYDVAANAWTERRAMPTPRGIGRAVTVGDRIYVIGGCQTFGIGLRTVEVYSPTRDSWWSVAPLPEPNHDFGAGVWRDSLVYVVGGGNWSSAPTCSVYVYDPGADHWLSATPLPTPLGCPGAAIVGDVIVVSTGFCDAAVNTTYLGTIDPQAPTRIKWSSGPVCPGELRCRTVAGAFKGQLFLVGGTLNDGHVEPEVRSFDPVTRTWARWADKLTAVANVYGLGVNSDSALYVAGGFPWTTPYAQENEGLNLRPLGCDVGLLEIRPNGRMLPGQLSLVRVLAKNWGKERADFALSWYARDSSRRQCSGEGTKHVRLDPGDTTEIVLGAIAGPAGSIHQISASVVCPGDENSANDGLRARIVARIGSAPDNFGYSYQSTQEPDTVAFDWIDPSPGRPVTGWFPDADDGYARRRLPFKFPYYGQEIEELTVFVNGCLETDTYRFHYNESLPCRGRNRMAVWWDDLDLRIAGAVYQYDDPAGNFVVFAWIDAPRFRASSERETFEAVLYRDGTIRFNYLSVAGTPASNTVGIQGRLGGSGQYQQYVFNGSPAQHLIGDSASVAFIPPESQTEQASVQPVSGRVWRIPTPLRGDALEIPSWGKASRLDIYDLQGRIVRGLDVRDREGASAPAFKGLATGVYFVRLSTTQGELTAKVVLAL